MTRSAHSGVRAPRVSDALWIGALRDEIVRAERARSPLSLLLVELEEAERMIAVEPRGEASATFGRFAQAVRTALRQRDVLACETESRAWIIARDTGRAGAQALGSRIVTAVPAEQSWRGAPLTVSVGLAVLGEDGHNAATLIDAAEQMRFAAEASGIGIITVDAGEDDAGASPAGPGSRRLEPPWAGGYCADGAEAVDVGAVVVAVDGTAVAPITSVPSIPIARPVAIVRSQLAPCAYGPRSITGTVMTRPL